MVQALTPSGPLLQNATVAVTLTTTNIQRAQTFYNKHLGLPIVDANDESFKLTCGNNTEIFVYKRDEAPKATNTVCAFKVSNLDETVAGLRNNGVKFEEYDLPGLKTINGIATVGTDRVAWIKDPDGNIIGIGTS